MLFNTVAFLIFLLVVLALFYAVAALLAQVHSARRQLLLLHELES